MKILLAASCCLHLIGLVMFLYTFFVNLKINKELSKKSAEYSRLISQVNSDMQDLEAMRHSLAEKVIAASGISQIPLGKIKFNINEEIN